VVAKLKEENSKLEDALEGLKRQLDKTNVGYIIIH